MLLQEIVATSAAVAGVPGRREKVAEIARLLARVPPDEVPIAVAFLSGTLLQRQIGIGYAALADLAPDGWADQARPAVPGAGPGPAPPALPESAAALDLASEGSGGGLPGLTLREVNQVFGEIGAAAGDGVQARRRSLLAGLFGQASAAEQRFLVRLITGELGQGAGEGIMVDAVATAAGVPAAEVRRAHQLAGWLPEVAGAVLAEAGPEPATGTAARGGRTAAQSGSGTAAQSGKAAQSGPGSGRVAVLRRFTLRTGRPVRPMLAASAPNLEAALARIRPAAIEWKIDGIRVQIHVADGQVGVFTRTLDDITERVPEIVAVARSLGVTSAVLDGEAVALRPDGRPFPFQLTSARAASRQAGATEGGATERGAARDAAGPAAGTPASVPLSVFLFDLLHADGEDLIDQPGSSRFTRLAEIAPAGLLIPRLVTGDLGEATEFFEGALRHGHEGVVVKSLEGPYQAGRRGSDWIKVKPRETLDLVILAAEWGHGRRTGVLSNLHLGARDPATGGFVMLGKTFKGLTDAMLAWQTQRLLELADQPGDRPPGDRPFGVVRVRPELVAEIAFDGVQASSRYPGGVTLRFARVLRYRTDKSAAEADAIDTVRELWRRMAAP